MAYEYRIYVFLAGDTRMQLCTVYTAEAAGALVASLCGASRPCYARIEIEIGPVTPGQ
jgi:hypothetical protein